MKNKELSLNELLKRVAIAILVCYLAFSVAFYFLAGEQLHLRVSRSNIVLPVADSGVVELSAGTIVDQHFTTQVQRLERISVQWGTYYRPNVGTVVMELFDLQKGQIVMSGIFDAATIAEGSLTTLIAETPLEGLAYVPLMLRVYSLDSQIGSAVAPLRNSQNTIGSMPLVVNGTVIEGMLCFSVEGTDYIWTGLHYWKFVKAGFVALLLVLLVVRSRYLVGKRSALIGLVSGFQKYSFLIRQLVSRDFKTKYKRSVFGMLWCFVNPLLTMSVQYFVFSNIFRSDIPNYAAYLLVGIVLFNFFSEACNMSMLSILGNASLITKVYMPKYIYPLTRVMSSMVNLGVSLIPLIIVALFTGVQFKKSALMALYFLICLVIFTLGISFILSSAMVFFRDTQFLWNVFNMVWMYATPVFYPETILPEKFQFVLNINPLYYFLKNARICILNGISPEPLAYAQCMLIALAMLSVGALFFKKTQDKFVLYL